MKSQLLIIAALIAWPAVASAQTVDAGLDAGVDAAAAEIDNAPEGNGAPPLECGGNLCDSSTGSTCTMSTPAPAAPIVLAFAAMLPLAALARRRRR